MAFIEKKLFSFIEVSFWKFETCIMFNIEFYHRNISLQEIVDVDIDNILNLSFWKDFLLTD